MYYYYMYLYCHRILTRAVKKMTGTPLPPMCPFPLPSRRFNPGQAHKLRHPIGTHCGGMHHSVVTCFSRLSFLPCSRRRSIPPTFIPVLILVRHLFPHSCQSLGPPFYVTHLTTLSNSLVLSERYLQTLPFPGASHRSILNAVGNPDLPMHKTWHAQR